MKRWRPNRGIVWCVLGYVAFTGIVYLLLSRLPLRIVIEGGQVEVIRLPVSTPPLTVTRPRVPTSIPTATVQAPSATPVLSTLQPPRALAASLLAQAHARPPTWHSAQASQGDWHIESRQVCHIRRQGKALILTAESGEQPCDIWPADLGTLSDLVLEVDARPISRTLGTWSVLVRDSRKTHYGATFGRAAPVGIWKWVMPQSTGLTGERPAPMYKTGGETNQLTVIAHGEWLIVHINGELLWEVRDDTLTAGRIVLRASAEGDRPFAVAFEDVRVWDIGDGTGP